MDQVRPFELLFLVRVAVGAINIYLMARANQIGRKHFCELFKPAMMIGDAPGAKYSYSHGANCFKANVPPAKKVIIIYGLKIPVTTILAASI